jgi:histidinol-phosphate phosphatase family protein
LIEDVGYPSRPEQVKLLPSAAESLRTLHTSGFALVLVSNQSGVGRGYFDHADAEAVHERFVELLADAGASLDAAYYCFHAPDEDCACRKPAPGMILDAAADLDLALGRSFMVGNSHADVEAGRAAGCRTIAFASVDAAADWNCQSWPEVTALVLEGRTR